MAYRVDNIPVLLKPVFYLYSYSAAIFSYGLILLVKRTCKIEKVGIDQTKNQNAIYAIWHENLVPYFMVYTRYKEPYVWMNHPLWFMKPVHIILGFMGIKKLILGSTGHGGRDAMVQIVDYLKEGYNTLLACDGPAGPYKELKYGVLEMSKLSGVPVIPIKFEISKFFTLSGWDKKKMPLPFSTIKVIYQPAILVDDGNYEESKEAVTQAMG